MYRHISGWRGRRFSPEICLRSLKLKMETIGPERCLSINSSEEVIGISFAYFLASLLGKPNAVASLRWSERHMLSCKCSLLSGSYCVDDCDSVTDLEGFLCSVCEVMLHRDHVGTAEQREFRLKRSLSSGYAVVPTASSRQ
jgi:hypothetical protein